MKKFTQPHYTIVDLENDKHYGKFAIEPLERGFGTTIGNALRRVLLSSLPGASVFSVEIAGARHEFAVLDGVEEDVMSIILNLKDLVLTIDDEENVTKDLKIEVEGPCEVTGKDIVCPLGVEVVNKDIHIATVANGGKFTATLHARNSRGYVTSENNVNNFVVGVIPTDSKYSPVEKVAFSIEPKRVDQDATYEQLTIEIWTNGSISPQEAISLASHILIAHLEPIVDLENQTKSIEVMAESTDNQTDQLLQLSIEELGLSQRSHNCLKRISITKVEELTQKSEDEMMKIRNLGKKSLKEIKDKLISMGLGFKTYE